MWRCLDPTVEMFTLQSFYIKSERAGSKRSHHFTRAGVSIRQALVLVPLRINVQAWNFSPKFSVTSHDFLFERLLVHHCIVLHFYVMLQRSALLNVSSLRSAVKN